MPQPDALKNGQEGGNGDHAAKDAAQ